MHNIHRENFYSRNEPAWHRLGEVGLVDESVLQVAARMEIPDIEKRLLYTVSPYDSQQLVAIPDMAAIYGVTDEQQNAEDVGDLFAVVNHGFQVLTHKEFLRILDHATHQAPVETLGMLGIGETIFTTFNMEAFDVKNETIEPYMLLVSPLTGKSALRGRLTSVRVVCWNTLMWAESTDTSNQITLRHRSQDNIAEELERWIQHVTGQLERERDLMAQVYNALADVHITDRHMQECAEHLWPNVDIERYYSWRKQERLVARNVRHAAHRSQVCELFSDSLTQTKAIRGTAWGMVNAVSEYIDHGGTANERDAQSAFMGAGMHIKDKAFQYAKGFLQGESK